MGCKRNETEMKRGVMIVVQKELLDLDVRTLFLCVCEDML